MVLNGHEVSFILWVILSWLRSAPNLQIHQNYQFKGGWLMPRIGSDLYLSEPTNLIQKYDSVLLENTAWKKLPTQHLNYGNKGAN